MDLYLILGKNTIRWVEKGVEEIECPYDKIWILGCLAIISGLCTEDLFSSGGYM